MKVTPLLLTLALGCASFSFGQDQGGPPPGGPGGFGGPQGGPGMRGGMQNGLPPLDRLVFRQDVQDDIKVTDDQKSKLDDLRATMRPQGGPGGGGFGGPPPGGGGQGGPPPFFDPAQQQGDQGGPPPGGPGGQGGPGGFRGMNDADRKKLEASIKAILTTDQVTRVHEIAVQLAGSRAVLDKDVQTQLGLTADQKTKVQSLVRAQQNANQSLFEKAQNGDLDRDEMRTAMQTNEKTFASKLTAVLTSDQQDKLKVMGGKAFKSTEPERGGFGGPPGGGGFGGPPRGGGQGGGQ